MILIIDDNKTRLLYLSEIIKEIDENIITAANGRDGYEMACNQQPALIILDMILPDIHGIEITKLLKQNNRTSNISIIAISSMVKKDKFASEVIQKGADDFLFLPMEKELILTKIKAQYTIHELFKKLRETSRLKDEFVSHVSHEFRSPLAIMRGFVDTMRTDPDIKPEEREEFLDLIATEIKRLSRMIEDLLDIAKIKDGSLTLNIQVNDLYQVVCGSVEVLRSRTEEKNISLDIERIEGEHLSFIDFSRIEDVVNNLINNAINYTPEGGIVTIRVKSEEMDSVLYNILEVSDTGKGIPEDKLDSIFESFFRVKDNDTYIKGVGLGLYLSKKIIEMHDGMIKVQSEPDKGSTFSIFLPSIDKEKMNDVS